jgi:hypothetical protein
MVSLILHRQYVSTITFKSVSRRHGFILTKLTAARSEKLPEQVRKCLWGVENI